MNREAYEQNEKLSEKRNYDEKFARGCDKVEFFFSLFLLRCVSSHLLILVTFCLCLSPFLRMTV